MNIEEKISQAKAKLLVEQPYFGTLASRLELVKSDNIQSFLSDGVKFQFNDEYVQEISLDELGFALSNGALHAALAHENRQNSRMSWLWQLATDHAINVMLVENGLSKPPAINYQSRFDGMYAEEIYAILKDEIQREEFNQDESNDTGFNEENKRAQNEMQNPNQEEAKDKNRPQMQADETLVEEQFKSHNENAINQAKAQDELPSSIERFFEIVVEPSVDWRHELHNALEQHFRADYSQMPPSKKMLSQRLYMPSLDSEVLRLVIAIDSSGSVDEALLSKFMAEIESLMMMFTHFEIDILVCDTKIHFHEKFVSGEALHVEMKGGGGTDFRPVFEWIDAELFNCNLLLYFSDTLGVFPKIYPSYKTFWISDKEAKPLFGELIVIK